MEAAIVKQEAAERPNPTSAPPAGPTTVIELSSSSDSDSEVDDAASGQGKRLRALGAGEKSDKGQARAKKQRADGALPLGFLDPLPRDGGTVAPPVPGPIAVAALARPPAAIQGSKQFWKAGDYVGAPVVDALPLNGEGMDHVRVHPKFLHSNATSHKWALGAFAELLDNALDEVCHGATFVNIDTLKNSKDGTRMLLIEDNGGGMDPNKMRQCMSLGYSAKNKMANTIGQYGNGFKTSTMRLGADVIVFSRSRGKDGKSLTQSIGLLSYTFLRSTGKEDIIVPMLDYEKIGPAWQKMPRSSSIDWNVNMETIVQWSPYLSEADLLKQLNLMSDQGTRIVIYNLWEDDQGALELDFDADEHDIQLGSVNRDEKKIEMAMQFPNSRHFLTYRHSLRSYASILYLRLPHGFRMILRGKEIEHHNLVNDMMLKDTVSYRPQPGADGLPKDPNLVAVVTMGFVKDAKYHIDVQGFNVYHKNRLIKPFWRVWNASGSDGRGVIGVLEANFVEPAHDKQGFERTTVFSRLETRLIHLQKTYWSTNCHKIGYAPRRINKQIQSEEKESSPEAPSAFQRSGKHAASRSEELTTIRYSDRSFACSNKTGKPSVSPFGSANSSGSLFSSKQYGKKSIDKFEKYRRLQQSRRNVAPLHHGSDSETDDLPTRKSQPSLFTSPLSVNKQTEVNHTPDGGESSRIATRSQSRACNEDETSHENSQLKIKQLMDENEKLKERIKEIEETMSRELQHEREKNNLLTGQLEATKKRLEEANKEQEAMVDIFEEERSRRDKEEDNLRKKLRDASLTIQELLERRRGS